MKGKKRLLTVSQFAAERGISRCTVYMWIKKERLKDVVLHEYGLYLIPDSNLKIEKSQSGRSLGSTYKTPTSSLEESRERYNLNGGLGYGKKISLTFDELHQLFEEGSTLEEIANIGGVTRQRIQQIHRDYFSPFISSRRDRRKEYLRERRKERSEAYVYEIEKLAIVKQIAEERNLKVETIQAKFRLSQCYIDRLLINGKLCRVLCSEIPGKIGSRNIRRYYRLNISKSSVLSSSFVIVITGGTDRRIFIFPSKVLADQYSGKERKTYKTFYIPEFHQEPYKNMMPKINWWKYEDAWDLLEETK